MKIFIEQKSINLPAASAAVLAAVEKAKSLGITINVAVVDSGGHLMSFLRMPGAHLHSIDIAIDKAYTSVGFGLATGEWEKILEDKSLLRENIQQRPRFISFGGGLPVFSDDGARIGAIGVSGGSESEDVICAQAGLEAISA